ncbi:hypothetical protein ACFQYP_51010 [Nonomuraea antimicrobica]
MARHDREESLEEQLAWLDAIKETEEAPVPVSASAAPADEPVASPYPKDPWLLVPQQHETATPPLFRAAVDTVYGPAAAEGVPQSESEAGEWLGSAGIKEEPATPATPSADDPFHAPLKPLPRPDDTDTYALPLTSPESAEETAWLSPSDWPGPGRDQGRQAEGDRPSAGEPARPEAEPEPVSAEEQPAPPAPAPPAPAPRAEEEPVKEERVAWADTQPGNERPAWADAEPQATASATGSTASATGSTVSATGSASESLDAPETRPHLDRPQRSVEASETMPRTDRPLWSDPETRAEEQSQDSAAQWPQQPSERPQWLEQESERPQWLEQESERAQWLEQDSRPSWPEPERPQWTEQPERPSWSEPRRGPRSPSSRRSGTSSRSPRNGRSRPSRSVRSAASNPNGGPPSGRSRRRRRAAARPPPRCSPSSPGHR